MNQDNKIIIAGYGNKGGKPRIPHEVPEGIKTGTSTSLGLSKTKIEVLDLLSEGEIQGLVTGEYINSGAIGDIGWGRVTFNSNNTAQGTGIRWLQSIYWNETPVVGKDGAYNFQQIIVNKTNGGPNGSNISDGIVDELTNTRLIAERLRGAGDEFSKIYRITNRNCIGAEVNVKITQLLQSSIKEKTLGDIQAATISYTVYYRPIFYSKSSGAFIIGKKETVTGKITGGFIQNTRVNFNKDYSTDDDFLGWEIKITRWTEESTTSTLRNQSFIDSLTEIYGSQYIYPNSAIVASTFDAEYFANVPNRIYHVELLKVKIPSNYDPITKTYDESSPWDGTFKLDNQGNILKQWTDNPAWCYYDLLTNKRYGLGLYIDEDLVDKFTLYEISKYCDTITSDGYGGLEPKLTCNTYITSQEEAYKMINSMASIFRGITYYSAGQIYASYDGEKPVVYQFTNANVQDGNFTYSSSSKKARHTIAIVRYNDKRNLYKPAIEYVENVDAIRKYGLRELEVPAFGCTSRGQAIRLGRWALLTESLETEHVNFRAGIEASFLRPGDIFQTFDANRKSHRLGGRLYDIVSYPTGTNIMLDSTITGLDSNIIYKFSLLTPTYYYDPSLVTGLTSSDISGIRKPQIQYLTFSGTNLSTVSGRTRISTSQVFDATNYNISGNLVWMVEATGNNGTGSIATDEWDTYRVTNIKETDPHIYEVEGLQYDISKFLQIESGFSFESSSSNVYIAPTAPTGLQLFAENISANSKIINYSFSVPDFTNINTFRIFVKTSAFSAGDENNSSYIIDELPKDINSGLYFPTQNTTYYFRAYSVSENNVLSLGYAENNILISNINPLKDVTISSLQLTSDSPVDNNPGSRQTGIYSTDSPIFDWQVGINGISNLQTDLLYRISVRKPSNSNIPSNEIYFQQTGFASDRTIYTFEFASGYNAVSNFRSRGPFREYDVVVEAMDSGGFSSAGGNFMTSLSHDANYDNPNGYDILYANNPQPTSVTLWTGTATSTFYQTGRATQQFLTSDGEIKIFLAISGNNVAPSGFFGDDIAGTTIYYCDLPFDAAEAKQQVPVSPSDKEINTIQVTDDSNPIIASVGIFNKSRQYIAIAPFDSFDQAIDAQIPNYLTTGLNLSNVVPIDARLLVGSYRAWVEVELGWGDNGFGMLNNNWQTKLFNVRDVKNTSVNENGNNRLRGVIYFETPLDSNEYGLVCSIHYYTTHTADSALATARSVIVRYTDESKIHLESFDNDEFYSPPNHPDRQFTITKLFVGVLMK